MTNYIISKEALEDLENIWIYTFHKWSVEQADRYHLLLIDEMKFISQNKMSAKSVGHIRVGYRMSPVKSHLIFYRISNKNVIEIIRILHKRIDIENNLKK
ncbi:MAG: type II toxin-antitoxin system RelE/ParE family toxin [Bacteroidetes bacterium]|nr:type II toxin-antitoxin system RelE/ParE family toxin [Bacteroidota bacterium]